MLLQFPREEQIMNDEMHVLRNHKDTVFRMLYKGKRELLELYNALNGSAYSDEEALVLRVYRISPCA